MQSPRNPALGQFHLHPGRSTIENFIFPGNGNGVSTLSSWREGMIQHDSMTAGEPRSFFSTGLASPENSATLNKRNEFHHVPEPSSPPFVAARLRGRRDGPGSGLRWYRVLVD